jgi:peptide-methionine (S)-S-oxide reductase
MVLFSRLTNLLSTVVPVRAMSTGPTETEIATFAAGCFWGVEHIFLKYYKDKGIVSTAVGYTGGREDVKNPNYDDVCGGRTDHAEALRIVFDPKQVSYSDLVCEFTTPALRLGD